MNALVGAAHEFALNKALEGLAAHFDRRQDTTHPLRPLKRQLEAKKKEKSLPGMVALWREIKQRTGQRENVRGTRAQRGHGNPPRLGTRGRAAHRRNANRTADSTSYAAAAHDLVRAPVPQIRVYAPNWIT